MSSPAARATGRWASLALLVLTALAPSGASAAGPPLLVEAEMEPPPSSVLRVRATNTTGEAARAATPEVIFQHQSVTAESVDLAAGAHHAWRIALPAPPELGTVPATVRIRHRTDHGADALGVAVVLVATPGAAASPVRASLSVASVARQGEGRIVLANTGTEPVAGRVFLMLPGGLTVDPQSQPAVIAPGVPLTLPLVVKNAGAPPGAAYPAYAVLQHSAGGVHYAAVGTANIAVEAPAITGGAVPLMVGAAALTMALAGLVLALRRSAPRRRSQRT